MALTKEKAERRAYCRSEKWVNAHVKNESRHEDLLIVAQEAIWQASNERMAKPSSNFLAKTAIGAMKRELRDRGWLIRYPGQRLERGERGPRVLLSGLISGGGAADAEATTINKMAADDFLQRLRGCCTDRQVRVLVLKARGHTLEEIGAAINRSASTAQKEVTRIRQKAFAVGKP